MNILKYALPVTAALLLICFFSGLPNLKTCVLPGAAASRRLTARDFPVLLLTLVYALVAFWGLGDAAAPETFTPLSGQIVELQLPAETAPAQVLLYCGIGAGTYRFDASFDGESHENVAEYEHNYVSVLKWNAVDLSDFPAGARYLRLSVSGNPWLGELVLLDEGGAVIPYTCALPALCDEADTAPAVADFSFLNSSYFDEIYHARTAWEHLNGVWPYEISHPPLGKLILSVGILLFGMNPFGWRFMGALFGVLMLPVMYALLKRLFGGRAVPTLGTIVFAADFMHFTQTRIATIDTYGVFFILLMYLFLLIWLQEGSLSALALSGVSFGLGAASKWTAVYAGAGLAVLWAAHWVLQCPPCLKGGAPVRTLGRGDTSSVNSEFGIRNSELTEQHSPCHSERSEESYFPVHSAFFKNVLFCLVFFVLVPAAIYYFAYLPYGLAEGCGPFSARYLHIVLDNQRFMFNYHSGIVAEHPYSSRWYQWLLDIRPILYYLNYFPDGTRSSIAAFVSPALCWGGLLSLFVLLYTAIFRRDRTAAFILVGYLAQLLPWVFIARLTFAYHYFPSSVFLVISLGYVFALLRENLYRWYWYAGGFAVVTVLLFVLFYPALSGAPIDNQLGTQLLGWLPTWPL